MIARFAGRCVACEQSHIQPGDEIQRRLGGVAAIDCVMRQDTVRSLGARIGSDMLRREGIGLGVFGLPPGTRSTPTRERFFSLALELGHCKDAEYSVLATHYRTLGLLDRALDD